MKKFFLLLAMSVLSSSLSFAQKKYEMVIEKTDGTESVFNTEDVARTYFRERVHSYTSCPDSNHPHLIDLGLPSGTKWACCNVGARSPEEYGGYYAWGETEMKEVYNESTYKYYQNGSYVNLGSDISGTKYDVAHVKWGGNWVMPTQDDFDELLDNCTDEWMTLNDVSGVKFTSKTNGNSIFLPAAGGRWDGDLYYAGEFGYYWSSTQDPDISDDAYYLYFGSGGALWDHYYRESGLSVRPVVRN